MLYVLDFVFVSVIFVNSVEKMYAHLIDVYVRSHSKRGGMETRNATHNADPIPTSVHSIYKHAPYTHRRCTANGDAPSLLGAAGDLNELIVMCVCLCPVYVHHS